MPTVPVLFSVLVLLAALALPTAAPADEPERFVAIRAGKIITISGEEIDGGTVVVANGKIRAIGRDVQYPRGARLIDMPQAVLMPGLIDPYTRTGLPSYARTGVNGDLRAADEFVAEARAFEAALSGGYTTVCIPPAGLGIPGRASVVRLARTPEVHTPAGMLRITADKRVFRGALERAKGEIEKVDKARKDHEAKAEQARKAQAATTQPATAPAASQPAFVPPPTDPKHLALVELIEKKDGATALLEVTSAADYLHFDEVLEKFEIAHVFVVRNGVNSDLYRVAEEMGEAKARVVAWPYLSRVPFSQERLSVPAILSSAGCEVSLTTINESAEEAARIRVRAAELVQNGWPRAEALKALTLHPARLLGLEARCGTIEKEKDADLVLLDGDPLAPGSRVLLVLVGGEVVWDAQAGGLPAAARR